MKCWKAAKRKSPRERALSFCRFVRLRQATEPPAFSIFPRPARLAEPTPIDSNLPRPASSPSQLPASRPIRWIVRESREANRTDSHSESPRPLSHGRISPALGRPTPIQPFPNPDMDGINRHSTTTQPSFGSNTRTTRFRLNHPTSLIRQLQPILKNKRRRVRLSRPCRRYRKMVKYRCYNFGRHGVTVW